MNKWIIFILSSFFFSFNDKTQCTVQQRENTKFNTETTHLANFSAANNQTAAFFHLSKFLKLRFAFFQTPPSPPLSFLIFYPEQISSIRYFDKRCRRRSRVRKLADLRKVSRMPHLCNGIPTPPKQIPIPQRWWLYDNSFDSVDVCVR